MILVKIEQIKTIFLGEDHAGPDHRIARHGELCAILHSCTPCNQVLACSDVAGLDTIGFPCSPAIHPRLTCTENYIPH